MSSLPTPPSAFPLRIAIIGGGISGLAAAHRLREMLPRAEIELFETADRLGGVLHTVKRSGFLIEQAADNFLIKPSAGIELCRRLGMAEELLTTDESRRRAFVVRSGKLIPVPEGFFLMSPRRLWPLLTSPLLSFAGKLRLLAEPFIPRAKSPSIGGDQGEDRDESIASFSRRRLGREVFEQLVQPLVAGIYTADPEQLSMAATMPQFLEYERTHGSLLRATLRRSFRAGEGEREGTSSDDSARAASGARYGLFVAPKGGMTSLVEALASSVPRLRIHLNATVASIVRVGGQWRLDWSLPAATISDLPPTFDAVVIALPAHAAAEVLEACGPELSAELSVIEYASCAVVSLGFARRQIGQPLDGFGFVVPQTERRRIIAGSFASLKFPGRAPENHVLVRAFIGGALQPEMLKLSDAELIRVAWEELAELLQISGEPVVTDIAHWPRSMPQYHVGHLDRVARIEELVAAHPTLALAGNAYRGVGIPQCIASGRAAAERIAAMFE
jgi:protoporphyrinogen/coproporphyrinogen III oxidase